MVVTLPHSSGRVQGVGFRWYVHREAAELAPAWLGPQQQTAGDVEAVAAGDIEDLNDLRTALHKGSRGSRVDAVIEHELARKRSELRSARFTIEGAW